jgi:diguanylate cyclase (GGDEF)-like protein
MTAQDKALELLLELGSPTERQSRIDLLGRALRTAITLMEADAVVIVSPGSRGHERVMLHSGSTIPAAIPLPPEGSQVLRNPESSSGQPLILADLGEDALIAAADGCPGVEAGPVIFTPVRQRSAVPAYIAAFRRRGRARFTMNDTRLMLLLGAWLNTALENLRLSSGSQKLAVTDQATDVYNYRFLKSALRRETRRASRFGHDLSVVQIDVDSLKQLQDELGPLKTNLVLKEMVGVLAEQVRSFDVLARYRQEEFMLVLPQTGRDGASEVAERARTAIERHAFSGCEAGDVTITLGVASYPQDAAGLSDLLRASDRALDQAKQRGRNCVATLSRKAA